MKKIYLAVLVLLLGIGVGGYFLFQKNDVAIAGLYNAAKDVVGTRTGTSTAGVIFQNNSATTTYPTWIGGEIDSAVYTFSVESASTTAQGISNLTFYLLASNDNGCDTSSTTSGAMNPILKKDINWFDASAFVKGSSGVTSLGVATTTWVYTTSGGTGTGKQLALEGINAQCLSLWLSGSSTITHVQLKTKENN